MIAYLLKITSRSKPIYRYNTNGSKELLYNTIHQEGYFNKNKSWQFVDKELATGLSKEDMLYYKKYLARKGYEVTAEEIIK